MSGHSRERKTGEEDTLRLYNFSWSNKKKRSKGQIKENEVVRLYNQRERLTITTSEKEKKTEKKTNFFILQMGHTITIK